MSKTQKLLLCDVLLFKEMEIQFDQCTAEIPAVNTRTDDANDVSSYTDTSLLVISLELVALEKLITFRQVMVRDLHSEHFPILNEFEALYSYKCGLFEECLEMCRSYLHVALYVDSSRDETFPVVYPEMLTLLDGDLVSFFGTVRLINPTCLLLFLSQHLDWCLIFLRTLSLYLMVQCQKKLCTGSLYETMQLIRFVHDATDDEFVLDRLVLKLIYRSLKLHSRNLTCAA